MARPRLFDEAAVIAQAAALFGRLGYNATSIDELLAVTGLQRGSLYKAFGSKRNLFEKVLLGAINSAEQSVVGTLEDSDKVVEKLRYNIR